MLYILTYATHSEGYFEILRKSCPNIIVLGFGDEWKGFISKCKAVVKFCESKNPEDIICFIDGFDSVCLHDSYKEITEKFKYFNASIVFSKAGNKPSIFYKYLADKLFGTCNNKYLNSGMYIGYSQNIIDFWKNMKDEEDDQNFATRKCSRDINIKIDNDNILFYNLCKIDKLQVKNNRIIVEETNTQPYFISAPNQKNMNPLLEKLGFTNLNAPSKYQYGTRFKRYFKEFIPELILIIISIFIFVFVPNKINATIICFFLFLELMHYELYVKHINTDFIYKFIYMLIDFFHTTITISVIFLIFLSLNLECNIFKLLLLDSLYLSILFLFSIFKMCILTIIENRILGLDENFSRICPSTRIKYFFDMNTKYKSIPGNNTIDWINGNRLFLFLIFCLNTFCLFKIYKKNKKKIKLF